MNIFEYIVFFIIGTAFGFLIAWFLAKSKFSKELLEISKEHSSALSRLEQMEDLDREVLTLKHFEHLSNKEAADVLDISYEAVKKRYVRALSKLQKILVDQSAAK